MNNLGRKKMSIFLPVILICLFQSNAHAESLYAADAYEGNFLEVDPLTGSSTIIGSYGSGYGPGLGIRGLAYDGSSMYGVTATGSLLSINLSDGSGTEIANLGLKGSAPDYWNSLASDPLDGGQLYGIAGEHLYKIGLDGTTVDKGAVNAGLSYPRFLSGLDFDASGNLWAVSFNTQEVGILDKNSGAFDVKSTTISQIHGLSFDENGTMYAYFSSDSSHDERLYTIDPSWGAANFIGNVDNTTRALSLEFVNAPTVTPEPATMALFGIGGAALAAARRRKSKKTNRTV